MSLPVTLLWGQSSLKKDGQTATVINLNLPPWCVNTSESPGELHLFSPNTLAPRG